MNRLLLAAIACLLTLSGLVEAHYNPRTGRFLSRDPIEEIGGVNTYAFVRNDPVNHWDILGLAPGDEHQTEEAAVTSGAKFIASATTSTRERGLRLLKSRLKWFRWMSRHTVRGGQGLDYAYGLLPNSIFSPIREGDLKNADSERIGRAITGVEFGMIIYWAEKKNGKCVWVEGSAVKGSNPTIKNIQNSRYGSVVVNKSNLNDPNNLKYNFKQIMVRMHTHNIGVYDLNYEFSSGKTIPQINAREFFNQHKASTDDMKARQFPAKHFIITEGGKKHEY